MWAGCGVDLMRRPRFAPLDVLAIARLRLHLSSSTLRCRLHTQLHHRARDASHSRIRQWRPSTPWSRPIMPKVVAR